MFTAQMQKAIINSFANATECTNDCVRANFIEAPRKVIILKACKLEHGGDTTITRLTIEYVGEGKYRFFGKVETFTGSYVFDKTLSTHPKALGQALKRVLDNAQIKYMGCDERSASLYKIWVSASIRQRPEHISSAISRYPHMYRYVFSTLPKNIGQWEKVPTGTCGFFPLYKAISTFEHAHPYLADKYDLLGIGKMGTPLSHKRWMHLAQINFNPAKCEIRVSKINKNVRPVLAMLQTAHRVYNGNVIFKENDTDEKKSAENSDYGSHPA